MLKLITLNLKNLPLVLLVSAALSWAGLGFAVESKTIKKAKEARNEELRKNKPAPKVSEENNFKAQKIRVKTINSIRKLLETTKEDARRYELMRRLGELYVEQAEYRLGREISDFEKQHGKWQTTGKKGKEPVASYVRSTTSLRSAINVYAKIVKQYPTKPGVDVTYYEIGKLLLRLEDESGVVYLKRLIKEHPKSELLPESYLALGEFYFDKHKIVEAKDYYIKAARYKEHKNYPFVVYKLGWAYYNSPASNPEEDTQNKKHTVVAFKLVVKLASQEDALPNHIYLRQEAINDLIIVWAETEDIESAWTYFRSIGSADSFYVMLEKLGSIYTEQGEIEKAIAVYSRILKESPNRPTNVENHAQLVGLYDLSNKVALVQQNLSTMAERYLKKGAWQSANSENKELLVSAKEKVERSIHHYASLYHKRAQKSSQKPLFEVAAALYALYLTNFPDSPKAYELRYFLADALFESGKFDLAATQYNKVVSLNEKDGKFLHDAALNSVIAMTKVVGAATFTKLPPPGQVPKPLEIPASKAKLLVSLDQYVRLFPQKPDAVPMKISAAEIQYVHGYYDDAIARYERITKENRNGPEAEGAVKVILGHYKERKDWDKVIAYTTTFLDAKGLLKGKLRDSTRELLIQASFNRALAFESGKNYKSAAEAFEGFQKSFPKEDNAPRALYNAMVNFYKVPDVARAIDAGKRVVKEYPNFDKNPDIVVTIADTYEGLADFAQAASFYAYFAKLWPKDKRSAGALFNAAILYKGLNEKDKAVVVFKDFIARHPRNTLTKDANMEMANILASVGKNAEAQKIYNEIASQHGKADPDTAFFAKVKAVEMEIPKNDPAKGYQLMAPIRRELLVKGSAPAPTARQIVAQISLDMVDQRLANFSKFSNKERQGDVAKVIQRKQQDLVGIARIFDEIISLGSPEHVVASLYKLGEAHDAFAEFIVTFPEPKEYSPSQREEFQASLNKGAQPLRNQAFQYYETAFKRSFEFEVFSDWGRKSYDKIALVKPAAYPKMREMQVEPGYLSHTVRYDKSVATSLE